MTPFRWKNCYADVQASKHDITIRLFMDDVVRPAITVLEKKIAEFGRSEKVGDVFAQADMKDVLRETKMAFSLSIQSIWERQLRSYLRGCAKELLPDEGLVSKVEKANWADLCALFLKLRGIQLEAFPSFGELETLHFLGNACRHGDGTSAVELAKRCPDLWASYPPMPSEFQSTKADTPSVAMMDVPIERLRAFVDAIAAFWIDAEYIYNESIERKHSSLEARLTRERAERKWLPQSHSSEVG